MNVSILTPTIVGREEMLAEAVASVTRQSVPAHEHVVVVDRRGVGPGPIRNEAARSSTGDWLGFLDDDDLLLPHHLAALIPHTDDFDVVYSLAEIQGRPGWDPQSPMFDPVRLRRSNYIPCTGIVRRTLFETVNGFPNNRGGYEDYDLWLALLDAGARFVCVPEVTWVYRFGCWDSRSKRHRRARGRPTW